MPIEAFLEGLAGSNKPFLHTSGSSIVADDAHGDVASDKIYDEDTPVEPVPGKQARVAIDRTIRDASRRGVRSIVVCPTMIYGNGLGLSRDSAQIPGLANRAKASGVVRHVGKGLNIWSNVHVEDVADIYRLALAKAPAGAFYFAENGEASYRDICAAIARRLKLGEPRGLAVRGGGEGARREQRGLHVRLQQPRPRQAHRGELGWQPKHSSATAWIERSCR